MRVKLLIWRFSDGSDRCVGSDGVISMAYFSIDTKTGIVKKVPVQNNHHNWHNLHNCHREVKR